MRIKYFDKYFYLFLFLYFFSIEVNIAQTSEALREDLKLVLTSNPTIQGLTYRIDVVPSNSTDGLSDFGFSKSSGSSNTLSSKPIFDYQSALSIQDSVLSKFNSPAVLHYMLYEKEVTVFAVEEYLDNLIRNELLLTNGNLAGVEDENEGQLILKGAKIPFKPIYKIKVKILTDIKMMLLIGVIFLFLVFSVILVLIMVIIKANKNRKDILTKRFKKLCYDPISTLLFDYELQQIQAFSQEDLEAFLPKNYLNKPLFKNVMIQEIISLNKNMKGDFKLKLKLIYRKLGLHVFTMKKLESKRWDIIAKGITEINEMDIVEALSRVQDFAYDKNFYIRSNAVATILNLSNDSELQVLVNQKYPLSRWQQMMYLRIIKYLTAQKLVKIENLFDSENESVRLFGIKLVTIMGRVEAIQKLSGLFSKAGDFEKIQILKTYDALNAESELEQIHQSLFSDSHALRIQAMVVLKNLGDINSQAILLERLSELTDFESKKAIVEALYSLSKDVFCEITKNVKDEELKNICNHLEDPILSHV